MTTPPVNDTNMANCICHMCPSYPGHNDPKLYCGHGKSEKSIAQEGCLCPAGCPVYSEYKLNGMYFCIEGKAK